MEERQEGENPVVLFDIEHRTALLDIGDQVGMAEHDALGFARRARGVWQHGDVGRGIEADLGRCRLLRQEVAQGGVALSPVDHDEVLGIDTDLIRRDLGLGQHRGDREQEARLRVSQLAGDFFGCVQGIDRRGGGACAKDSMKDAREYGDVGAQHAHYVTDLHSSGGEGTSDGVDLADQLRVRGLGSRWSVDEGDAVEVDRGEIGEEKVVNTERWDQFVGKRACEHEISFDQSGSPILIGPLQRGEHLAPTRRCFSVSC